MPIARRHLLLTGAALTVAGVARAQAMSGAPLRVVWLQGNPVQARAGADGKAEGPAIDMAQAIAKKLGRPLEVTAVAGTDAVLQKVRSGAADLAFIAFDPTRGDGVYFTPPYLLSLNTYAVLPGSKLKAVSQADAKSVRIGAIATDSGGLYLKRTLQNATLVPVTSVETGIEQLKAGAIDTVAANSQRLIDIAAKDKGVRVLPGHFYEVPQTIALRDGSDLILPAVNAVIEARSSGALKASIARWKLAGAAAPTVPGPVTAKAAAADLAPSGTLRVAINLGNSVLASRNATTGELGGISVILARELAARLGLPIELIPFNSAGDTFDALEKGRWDVAFLAVELERATKIDFSPPYVAIDGTYMVYKGSPYRKVDDVDRPGVKISVGRGAAYDLYLTRTLKNAELLRTSTSTTSIDAFFNDRLEATAGVRQALEARAKGRDDVFIMPDRFTRIDQAIGVPKGHPVGAAYIRNFIEEMKATGKVRTGLDATGQQGAPVAPPA